jgi:2-keto-4-pentenoate hydratase/2-oxohepta-3-ene-1,7-dioic acid hydratase in catechol pathway
MADSRDASLFGRFSYGKRTFVGAVRGWHVSETDASSMADIIAGRFNVSGKEHELATLKVLVPIDRPSKIVCIGLNYRSHIKEMKWETPKVPIIFSKPSSSMIGPGENIMLPDASSRVDYEGESAIVIGKRATRVSDGASYIFGYTCLNDVTARDLQKSDVDWTRAKGFDTFCPVGPVVSTKAPTKVTTRLNDKVVQESLLSDRVFDDAALVEYISSIMTLETGDIIATGTPSGISRMSPGDVVEVELDGVGRLRNQVVKSP